MPATPKDQLSQIAAGAQVVVRDEEWLVRSVQQTPADGHLVRCVGTSPFVRDTEASFLTDLDRIEPLRPESTRFVPDTSAHFRNSRLLLEAVIRKTPVAAGDTDLAVVGHQLLNRLDYQRRAAKVALDAVRPRVLIADAVGLGKTLEVGMILSELIRRGRGERILVVTPRHILEQFQHELWTRFAIPLVRLDSEGIARVQRTIPANRNPFTYYKRSIISVDTLKSVGRYRHHLEGIHWDAVVIDECHNVTASRSLRNRLAHLLAPRTDALLLTSATPHNGDAESFAELIRLLDPTAVSDAASMTAADIEHLYIRRHKHHDEVRREVGFRWADRLPPRVVPVTPDPSEAAMLAELADTWTHPAEGQRSPSSGTGASLFPWTLFKAALSSHRALAETVANRRRTLRAAADANPNGPQATEDAALARLGALAQAVDDTSAAKLVALADQLRDIGVGSGSPTRVVVFSERIATLDWLARELPAMVGLGPDAVRVLHGGLADVKQMDVIGEFGLAESPVRLLLTGDMASEGVNLHRQCHHLIHFDLPWSLITIEQRNGRIDRYGQEHAPDIRALVVSPDDAGVGGDARVLSKLLAREFEAHRAFGEAGSLMGLHAAGLEEDSIAKALRDGVDVDAVVPERPAKAFDLMALLTGGTGFEEVPERRPPSLFASDHQFVTEALGVTVDDPRVLDLRTDDADPTLLSMVPPPDLARRLSALPQSYLSELGIAERLRLTADPVIAEQQLSAARESTSSLWPAVGHLSPLHPVVDWLVDRVLAMVGRSEAPLIVAGVDRPTFCVQGVWSNGRGRPQVVEWMAVTPNPDGTAVVSDLFTALDEAGVGPEMANTGVHVDTAPLTASLPAVLTAAREHLVAVRANHRDELEARLAEPRSRLARWAAESAEQLELLEVHRRSARQRRIDDVVSSTTRLIDSLRISGDPLVRVLAVLVPHPGGG